MRFPRSVILCLLLLGAVSCATMKHAGSSERVQHIVICWLKTPGDAAARQKLIDESRSFKGEIPGLDAVSAGPMLPSDRLAVDSTFDVAVVMTFRDRESLREYDQHPRHKEAVEQVLKPLVAKFICYDFIDTR